MNVVQKWLKTPPVKNELQPFATANPATIAVNHPIETQNNRKNRNNSSSTASKTKNTRQETAREVSCILSGWYQKITPDEWQGLADYHPEWMQERNRLENELDGHFFNNNPEAGKEVFYRLLEHLKNIPTIAEQKKAGRTTTARPHNSDQVTT